MISVYLLLDCCLFFKNRPFPYALPPRSPSTPFPSRPLPPLLTVKYDAAAVVLREY